MLYTGRWTVIDSEAAWYICDFLAALFSINRNSKYCIGVPVHDSTKNIIN